jgi:TPR repeat protein
MEDNTMNNGQSAAELCQLAKGFLDASKAASESGRRNEEKTNLDKAKHYADLAAEAEEAAGAFELGIFSGSEAGQLQERIERLLWSFEDNETEPDEETVNKALRHFDLPDAEDIRRIVAERAETQKLEKEAEMEDKLARALRYWQSNDADNSVRLFKEVVEADTDSHRIAHAAYSLGLIFSNEKYSRSDADANIGYQYLQIAAKNGHKEAQKIIDQVKKNT